MSRDTATEPQTDVVRVQEELLEMLRMAGNEAPPPRREAAVVAAAPQASTNQPAARTCMKCGSEKPWGKSNWCPDCGYYPKAGFGGSGAVESADDAPPPSILDILPPWVIPTAIGSGALLFTSIFFRFVFYDALARSFLAIAQFLFFGFLVIAVHCRAAYLAVNSGRGWIAFVNPTETWMLMLNMMPKSKVLIVLLGVGLSGVCTSFLVGPDPELIVRQSRRKIRTRKT